MHCITSGHLSSQQDLLDEAKYCQQSEACGMGLPSFPSLLTETPEILHWRKSRTAWWRNEGLQCGMEITKIALPFLHSWKCYSANRSNTLLFSFSFLKILFKNFKNSYNNNKSAFSSFCRYSRYIRFQEKSAYIHLYTKIWLNLKNHIFLESVSLYQ